MNEKKYIISILLLSLILIISIVLYKLYKTKYEIFKLHNCKNTIQSDLFIPSLHNNGNNWSINFWIYIKDLSYNYAINKSILEWDNCNIWLTKSDNGIVIQIPVYYNEPQQIIYKNLPIQKWINIAVILENRYLDLWINNKLYVSKYLKNLPIQKFNNDALITLKNKSFSGYISKFQYFNFKLPREHLYKHSLSKLFIHGPL